MDSFTEELSKNGEAAANSQASSNKISKITSVQSAPTPTGAAESPGPKRRMSRADRAAAKAAQAAQQEILKQ